MLTGIALASLAARARQDEISAHAAMDIASSCSRDISELEKKIDDLSDDLDEAKDKIESLESGKADSDDLESLDSRVTELEP